MEPNAELGRAVTEALRWMGASADEAAPTLGINARTLHAMCGGIVPMRSLVIRFATGLARSCEGRPDAPEWWSDVDAWLARAGYPPRRETAPGAPDRSTPRPPSSARPSAPPERFPQPPAEPPSRPGAPGQPSFQPPVRRAAPLSGNSAASAAFGHPPTNGTAPVRDTPPAAGPGPEKRDARDTARVPDRPAGPEDLSDPFDDSPADETDPIARTCYRPTYERESRGEGGFMHVFRLLDEGNRVAFEIEMPPEVDYRARAARVKEDLATLTRSAFERRYARYRVAPR